MVILPPLAKGIVQTQQMIFNLFKISNFFGSHDSKKGSRMKVCFKIRLKNSIVLPQIGFRTKSVFESDSSSSH